MPIQPRQNWLKPHLPGMRPDLTDEEDAALARLLSDTIKGDRYPLLARIRLLKRILGRIRPERSPAPPWPPIGHREIHRAYKKRRIMRFWKIRREAGMSARARARFALPRVMAESSQIVRQGEWSPGIRLPLTKADCRGLCSLLCRFTSRERSECGSVF